ncbi:TetR/AcrR family transcriptional regulator [Empedobacter falsenii]
MENFTDRQIEIMEAATARIDKYGIQNLTIKTLAADIGLSEPALYRHFKSKNEILLCLLHYFITKMKKRSSIIIMNHNATAEEELRIIFNSQLQTFTEKPAIVSVIFAESIFHFDGSLSNKVSEIIELMQQFVQSNIERGQREGQYNKRINASTLTTIILGSIRMTVLKWKISGHSTDLVNDGKIVLETLLEMIENKKQ